MSGVPVADERNGAYILTPKKKSTPLTKPQRIIIGALAAPSMIISEKEEPTSRGDDIIRPPAGLPLGELIERAIGSCS